MIIPSHSWKRCTTTPTALPRRASTTPSVASSTLRTAWRCRWWLWRRKLPWVSTRTCCAACRVSARVLTWPPRIVSLCDALHIFHDQVPRRGPTDQSIGAPWCMVLQYVVAHQRPHHWRLCVRPAGASCSCHQHVAGRRHGACQPAPMDGGHNQYALGVEAAAVACCGHCLRC